jgi:hypothetical protein
MGLPLVCLGIFCRWKGHPTILPNLQLYLNYHLLAGDALGRAIVTEPPQSSRPTAWRRAVSSLLPARTLGIDRTLHTYHSPAQISTRHLVAGWSATVRLNE